MSSNTPTPPSRSNERINRNIPEHQTNAPIANGSEVRERINNALMTTVCGDAYEIVGELGLPSFSKDKRARFSRDKVIQEIFRVLGVTTSVRRIMRNRISNTASQG
jgi:hypothetical protein